MKTTTERKTILNGIVAPEPVKRAAVAICPAPICTAHRQNITANYEDYEPVADNGIAMFAAVVVLVGLPVIGLGWLVSVIL